MASKIIDSTGKTVGTFVSFFDENTALVQFKIGNKNYMLPVYPDKIGNDVDEWLYYTQLNCVGQAYVGYSEQTGLVTFYNLTPFGWLNLHPEGVTPQTILPLSYSSTSGCTNIPAEPLLVITLEEATGPDFRAGFTPPFMFES